MKSKFSRKGIIFASAASLVVVSILGYLVFAQQKQFWPFQAKDSSETTTSGPTAEQKKAEDKVAVDQKTTYIDAPNNDQVPPVPTSSESIDLSTSRNGDSVTIVSKLAGLGYSEGSCELGIINNTKNFSETANIIYQPEFSTCAGFSVPVSKLGTGTWDITLSVTPLNGSAITKTTSLEVK